MLVKGVSCCTFCYEEVKKAQEKNDIGKEKKNQGATPSAKPARVFTERRNGMVHQYSIYSFTCSRCKKTMECRTDDIPRPYEDYQGKRYCRKCWEEMEKILTEPCRRCGKPITLAESRHLGKAGMCASCWTQNMKEKRELFGAYRTRLLDCLKENGIAARGTDTEGLNEDGQPCGYHAGEERNHGMIKLRQTEYSIGTFHMDGGWFAIPERGSALRYIKPSGNKGLMEFLASVNGKTVLAAAVDDFHVYILSEDGLISSTSRKMDGKRVFSKEEILRETAARHFSEEKLEEIVRKFMDGTIRAVDHYYYDTAAKVFFEVLADGNYYHGYDVSYPVISKEEVLKNLSKRAWLIPVEEEAKAGAVPIVELVKRLPEAQVPGYKPPENFGYGVHFV